MNDADFAEAKRLYDLFYPDEPTLVINRDVRTRAFGGLVIGLGLAALLALGVAYVSP